MNARMGVVCRGLCVSLWCVVAAASSGGEPGPPASTYCVSRNGLIQKLDETFAPQHEVLLPGLGGRRHVRDADITPDGKLLLLAVTDPTSPLIVVDAATLDVKEGAPIAYPGFLEPWVCHEPWKILALGPDYICIQDEVYMQDPEPFSVLLVNLKARTAKPLRGLQIPGKSHVLRSPDGSQAVVIGRRNRVYVINADTGQVATHEHGVADPKTRAQIATTLWNDSLFRTVWLQHPEGQVSFACERVLNIVSGEQSVRKLEDLPVWASAFDTKTALGQVLLAYALGGRQFAREWPVMDTRLQRLLAGMKARAFDHLPSVPDIAFVSAAGRYLASVNLSTSAGGTDDSKRGSSVVFLDTFSGKVVREMATAPAIVSVLFGE